MSRTAPFSTAAGPPALYTLSLHDALPILARRKNLADPARGHEPNDRPRERRQRPRGRSLDRKSTRLNSSHRCISYAVFCLKKKKVEYGPGLAALARALVRSEQPTSELH